jgi:hypothetical protein
VSSRLVNGMRMKRVFLGAAAALLLSGAADARYRLDGDFSSESDGGLKLSVRSIGDVYAVRVSSEKCGRSLEGFARADSVVARSLQFEKKIEGQEDACYVQLGYDPKADAYVIDSANCERHVNEDCEFDGVVMRSEAEKRRRWSKRRPRPRYAEDAPGQVLTVPPVAPAEVLQQSPERRSLFGSWPF